MVEAAMVFIISLAMLIVVNVCFGGAMESLHGSFSTQLTTLHLTAGWVAVGSNILLMWDSIFFNLFMFIVILLVVWVAKTAIIEAGYSRQKFG